MHTWVRFEPEISLNLGLNLYKARQWLLALLSLYILVHQFTTLHDSWFIMGGEMKRCDQSGRRKSKVTVLLLGALLASCISLNLKAEARGSYSSLPLETEIDAKLKLLNKPGVKTIHSEDGDIIDCVDIYKQPAFDHPALKNHIIQEIPNFLLESKNKNVSNSENEVTQVWQRSGSCPKGTIPIRRIKKEDLLRTASLQRFGMKPPEPYKNSANRTNGDNLHFLNLNATINDLKDNTPDNRSQPHPSSMVTVALSLSLPGRNLFSSLPSTPPPNSSSVTPTPTPSPPIPIPKYPPPQKSTSHHPPPPKPPQPALKYHRHSKYHKPVRPGEVIFSDGDRSVIIGESGVYYVLPGAPFEFQFSYSERPKVKPLAIREPAFLPFAPPTMPRPWTAALGGICAQADINIWNPSPNVELPDDFTTAQMWLKTPNGRDLFESVEAGWMVNPVLFGDKSTRLFACWTRDSYMSTGCFNLKCPGFVQTSGGIALGTALSPLSSIRGPQYDFNFGLFLDPHTQNWWFKYNESPVGYFPAEILSGLRQSATLVEWGGQVFSTDVQKTPHTGTGMGSGQFSSRLHGQACYMKNIRIQDYSLQLKYPQFVDVMALEPHCYSALNYREGFVAEPTFYFGGPGRVFPYCP
ncbi:hypothetical protein RIF29_12596 [Crotalaria pallida]|uniref:Neprosin PEP catalytic domain-containing protein n=1 Tax=Crotalaria pallida TaxID=3830 RepID=A0AAN9P177_CROPI